LYQEPHGPQVGRTAGGGHLRAGYQPSGGTVSSSNTVVTSAEVIKDSDYRVITARSTLLYLLNGHQ